MARTPILVTDAAIFDNMGRVLVIKRKYPPFQGNWALPGGHVEQRETAAEAVIRELAEETSLWLKGALLHLTGFYDDPLRDPRGDYVSVAFAGIVEHTGHLKARDDAEKVTWMREWASMSPGYFAFDHHQIISDAWEALTVTRQLAGQYGKPDPEVLNPRPIRLTPAQRLSLERLYSGQAGLQWEDTYPGLIRRGLVISQMSEDKVIYQITTKGKEAISK